MPDSIIVDGLDITFEPLKSNQLNNADESESKFAAQPVDLVWSNITLTVPEKKEKKRDANQESNHDGDEFQADIENGGDAPRDEASLAREKIILDGISGSVSSGQMLAVMGSSGAGKTSLLNLLAGRATPTKGAKARGSLSVNGAPRDYNTFNHQSAYVLQDDDMFAELTVREQINYAATLRLPRTMSRAAKAARVDRVIEELGIAHVQNTQIGNEYIRGVSGGERKRVAIGTELVTDPSVIFLDEPTSGLDAFNAFKVMETLRLLASKGRTVVCTIHQPRSSIFALFDQLLLLSQGKAMYHGPAAQAETYFSSIGFKAPANFNPADYFVDLLSVDLRTQESAAITKKRIAYIAEKHQERAAVKYSTPSKSEGASAQSSDENSEKKAVGAFANSWIKELAVLCGRAIKLVTRAKMQNVMRLVQTVFFSILLGLLWQNRGRKTDPASIQSIPGVLFFMSINQSLGGAFGVIFSFPLQRSVVMRERAANSYRTSSYFISKATLDFIRGLIFVFIFSTFAYFLIGLRPTAGGFFKFVLTLFMMANFAESLALCLAILTGDPEVASSLLPLLIVLNLLFAGFFIAPGTIPDWMAWFKWLSFMQYGFNALGHNQFPGGSTNPATDTPIFNSLTYWENIGALLGLNVLVKIVGYLFLHYLRGPKFAKLL